MPVNLPFRPDPSIRGAISTGSGEPVLAGENNQNIVLRTITGSGAISVSESGGVLVINASAASGEANTASNVGSGEGVFQQKNAVDLRFRSILGAGSVSVLSGTNEITISGSAVGGGGGETNTASNVGSGEGVFQQKSGVDLQFRSITTSGSISSVSGSSTINLSSSALLSGSNTGLGESVFVGLIGVTASFRTLSGLGGVSISPSGGELQFSSTANPITAITASNIGTGENVFQSITSPNQLNFRSLVASGSVSVLSGTNTIAFSSSAITSGSSLGTGSAIMSGVAGTVIQLRSIAGIGSTSVSINSDNVIIVSSSAGAGAGETNTASNIGAGEGVWAQKNLVDLQFRSLVSSGSVSVLSGTNTIAISSSAILSGSTTGTGEPVFLAVEQTNLKFRSLVGTGATTVSSGSFGTIVINTPAGSGSPVGDVNTFQYNASGSFSGSNVLRFATGGVQLSGVIRSVPISTPSTASISGTREVLKYTSDNFTLPPCYTSYAGHGLRSPRIFGGTRFGSSWGEWQQMAFLAHTGNFVGFSMNSTGTSLFIPPSGTAYDLSVPRQRWACTQNNTGAVAGVFGKYALVKRGTTILDGGGFFFYSRFKIPTNVSGNRAFIGLHSGGNQAFGIDPSGLLNCFGVGYSTFDNLTGNFFVYSADASTRFSAQIPNMPRTNNNIYEIFLYCSGAAGTMNWHVNNITSASFCASGTITTSLPAADTYLRHHLGVSNGSGSTTSNHFELMNLWWESGF